MKRIPLILLLAAAACRGDPTTVDASCVAGVFANDLFYGPSETLVDSAAVSEDPHLRIVRFQPVCHDQGEVHVPVNGESNFLPVGTPLYTVDGFGPLERLTYWDSDDGVWRALIPGDGSACSRREGGGGALEPPCGQGGGP